MTAEEAIDQLVKEIMPPKGTVITLRERKPEHPTETNWIPGTGLMLDDRLERYMKAVAKLRDENPHVDWTGVEKFDGEERHLARYWI